MTLSGRIGIFAPQYYGSLPYYATMAQYERVVIDAGLRYNKRFKSIHRCEIADTRGKLTLTVPVSKPETGHTGRWSDMRVSAHGQWWQDHRVSLESAYGRTPFFEFYIDRFMPWLRWRDESIVDFDLGLDAVVRRTLSLPAEVVYTTDGIDPDLIDDYRNGVYPTLSISPYYQVRAAKLGFIPNLSILDLIFNMGTEAPLVLMPRRPIYGVK